MSYYESLLQKRGIKLTEEQVSIRNAWFVSQNDKSRRYKHPVSLPLVRPAKSAFDEHGNRICCICDIPKPSECFGKGSSKIDGKDARCKPCKSRQVMEYMRRVK